MSRVKLTLPYSLVLPAVALPLVALATSLPLGWALAPAWICVGAVWAASRVSV